MKKLLIAQIALLLAACTTSKTPQPDVVYYVLDGLPQTHSIENRQAVTLGSLQVPAYLNQLNLVMRQKSHQIYVAKYHSWAEPVPDSIRRVMKQEITAASDNYLVTHNCEDCLRVDLNIEHFYPTDTGQVILAGEYTLVKGTQLSTPNKFNYAEQLSESGYQHSVEKLRGLLIKLSEDIANKLNQPF